MAAWPPAQAARSSRAERVPWALLRARSESGSRGFAVIHSGRRSVRAHVPALRPAGRPGTAMPLSNLALQATERGIVPDAFARAGIRRLLRSRLAEIAAARPAEA